MQRCSPYRYRGFTLLEVLVSASILAIVLSVLLGILSTGLSTWRVTQGKIETESEGRSGALLLMQDIDNIILPAESKLWPNVAYKGKIPYLRFLTLKPQDYQETTAEGNIGDVCYVEYFFSTEHQLMRRFYSSRWTYDNILKAGVFPAPSTEDAQLLSTNLLAELRDATRGTNLYSEAGQTGFVLLSRTNPGQEGSLLPLQGAATGENPPVGVEINFAVTDGTSAQNPQLLENPNYRLRNAEYISLRYDFPNVQ